MSAPAGNLLVFVGERFACVKVTGRANFTLSIDFKTLLSELRHKGFSYFVLELGECVLMDSTFLGVLAGFGLQQAPEGEDDKSNVIELRNPNPRVRDLLETLGILHLFKITEGATLDCETTPVASQASQPSRLDITAACLEAHQTLMNINPENVARFKDVAKFLAEDLQKLKSSS